MSRTAPVPNLLEESEREDLRRIIEKHGLNGTARRLDVSRGVISSVVAGIAVRKGSIEMLRNALAAYRKAGGQ